MRHTWILAAVALGAATPALGCSQLGVRPVYTDDQVQAEAQKQVRNADVIIDAMAVARLADETVIFRTLRTFKGPQRSFWRFPDHRCGTYFPKVGQKSRLLMARMVDTWWAAEPDVGIDIYRRSRLDRAIDRLLRHERPGDFVTIGPEIPPPPPRSKRR